MWHRYTHRFSYIKFSTIFGSQNVSGWSIEQTSKQTKKDFFSKECRLMTNFFRFVQRERTCLDYCGLQEKKKKKATALTRLRTSHCLFICRYLLTRWSSPSIYNVWQARNHQTSSTQLVGFTSQHIPWIPTPYILVTGALLIDICLQVGNVLHTI